MKHCSFFSIVCVFALFMTYVHAQTVTDPVAYWNFDGHSQDISGNGHHATINGDMLWDITLDSMEI